MSEIKSHQSRQLEENKQHNWKTVPDTDKKQHQDNITYPESNNVNRFEVLCDNEKSDEEEMEEEDQSQRREATKDITNEEKKETRKFISESISLEALKSVLENYKKDNESKEDVVGGKATDKKGQNRKKETKEKPFAQEKAEMNQKKRHHLIVQFLHRLMKKRGNC